MKKILVIVESPAKISKIESFLGNKYKVMASYGHINNLGKNRKDLGIDIENDYKPSYYLSFNKFDVVNKLRAEAKKSKSVILASDKDAEGEAIAYHICNILNLNVKETDRIIFNSITKDEILRAVNNPTKINMDLVRSQQTRQILDKLIGYSISPTLWKQIGNGLSAGRCQSPAVKLLHDKELEIEKNDESTHYKVDGLFNKNINAILNENIKNEKETLKFLNDCNKSKFSISDIKKSIEKNGPSPPFITSTLQQECYNKFNMNAKNTMSVAQKLYEKGLITYHRTDSISLLNEANIKIKKYIIDNYGERYYNLTTYKTKSSSAQEAHECIRPVNIDLNELSKGVEYEKKVYNIIWKRCIASQMSKLEREVNKVNIDISKSKKYFIAKFEEIKFDGYLKVYNYKKSADIEENEDLNEDLKNSLNILDKLKVNMELINNNINANEKFDKTPNHYSESSLIKELEKKGIGRPSTYANIMESIQNKKYAIKESRDGIKKEVKLFTLEKSKIKDSTNIIMLGKEKNKLYITDLGKITTDFLDTNFSDLMNYNYTSKIEMDLDKVSHGKKVWHNVIDDYYKKIEPCVNEIKNSSTKKFKKVLGHDNKTGDEISIIVGKYGPVIKSGCGKESKDCKFAKIKNIQNITSTSINDAKEQLSFPLNIGQYKKKDIHVKDGRYGYYLNYNDKNYNIKNKDITDLKLNDYIKIIKEIDSNIIKEFDNYRIINGKYGPYIHNLNDQTKNKFIRIPKDLDPLTINSSNIKNLINKK